MSDFYQQGPSLQNTFTSHRWLGSYLNFKFGPDQFKSISSDLSAFGEKCAGQYMQLAKQAEQEKPEHIPFDAWGKRIDLIRTSPAWQALKSASATEGLIEIAYARKWGELSRVYQFAKLFLFHPSSAFYTCPLAMADGAAKVLEIYGKSELHKNVFRSLTSNDPAKFWTSGQWMTEKTGGSDVSQTSTVAKVEGDQIRLYGLKWFSSATTSEVALALARFEDSAPGSKGLSLFLIPTFLPYGSSTLNGIEVLRLKDKLGTRALPTAELRLEGTKAYLIGERDQGVRTVATMLNITRLYNSICSVGSMNRGLELLRDYSEKRSVFGRSLSEQPLHQMTFAAEEAKLLAGFLLSMDLVHILGKEECQTASATESTVLRLMTPVCKLFTAKAAVSNASEVLEGFGGAGYIEDTGLPGLLRDSQVFPIWEGATNVLSLDLYRALTKSEALDSLQTYLTQKMQNLTASEALLIRTRVVKELADLRAELGRLQAATPDIQVASMRSLAVHLAWTYSLVLMADWLQGVEPGVRQKLNAWVQFWPETKWSIVADSKLQAAAQMCREHL